MKNKKFLKSLLFAGVFMAHSISFAVESPIEFGADQSKMLNENSAQGVLITDINNVLTDDDKDQSGNNIIYSIVSGNDDAKFVIDSGTGEVTLDGDVNYEDVKSYSLIIKGATEDGGGTIGLTIIILDVNDAPKFKYIAGSKNNYKENAVYMNTIGGGVTDEDEGQILTYTLEGADSAYFTLDGDHILFTPADYENPLDEGGNNIYYVSIRVTDNGVPALSDTYYFTIKVNNVIPIKDYDKYVDVEENTVDVITLSDFGLDPGDDTVFYRLGEGNDADLFEIDLHTGELKFKTAPDFENPADVDFDNVYQVPVNITVENTTAESTQIGQGFFVTVNDVEERSTGGGHSRVINNDDDEMDREDRDEEQREEENNGSGSSDTTEELKERLVEQIRVLRERINELLRQRAIADFQKVIKSFDSRLVKGDTDATKNGAVSELQEFLISEEVYPEALVTGYYGDLTGAAVMKWEEKNNISYPGVEWRPLEYLNMMSNHNDKSGFAIGGYRLDCMVNSGHNSSKAGFAVGGFSAT